MTSQAFNPNQAAVRLQEAMKGWGTDEEALIRVIANLNVDHIKPLRDAYRSSVNKDLLEDIKSETRGQLEDTLVAALTPLIEYDCQLLRKSMKGLGTDEEVLLEIMCTRTPQEIKAINTEFKSLFEHDLETDLRDETAGPLKDVLVQRLKAEDGSNDLERDVEKLFQAGQGSFGTDEAVFINVLSHRSPDYISRLNVAYSNKYGKSLTAVVKSECSGDFKKALFALVTPASDYFAEKLFDACSGAGTNDDTLIRVICSQRGRCLKEIAHAFLSKYNQSLKSKVADECSGDYKKLLVGIIEHYVEGRGEQ